MNRLHYIILYLSVAFGACRSSEINSSQSHTNQNSLETHSKSNFRQLAVKILGEELEYVFNDSQTIVLCKKTEAATRAPMVNSIRFMLISLADNAIVYEDRIINGSVEWYTSTQLKITTLPEIIQRPYSEQAHYYIYDVETEQKIVPGSNKY